MLLIADTEALRRARSGKSLTRPQVAERIGISVHTIREIERGRRQPSLNVAMKLAGVYQQPLEALVKVAVSG